MDFLLGALTGISISMAIMHLYYKKWFTFSGWVDKKKNPGKYWSLTVFYSVFGLSTILFMYFK